MASLTDRLFTEVDRQLAEVRAYGDGIATRAGLLLSASALAARNDPSSRGQGWLRKISGFVVNRVTKPDRTTAMSHWERIADQRRRAGLAGAEIEKREAAYPPAPPLHSSGEVPSPDDYSREEPAPDVGNSGKVSQPELDDEMPLEVIDKVVDWEGKNDGSRGGPRRSL